MPFALRHKSLGPIDGKGGVALVCERDLRCVYRINFFFLSVDCEQFSVYGTRVVGDRSQMYWRKFPAGRKTALEKPVIKRSDIEPTSIAIEFRVDTACTCRVQILGDRHRDSSSCRLKKETKIETRRGGFLLRNDRRTEGWSWPGQPFHTCSKDPGKLSSRGCGSKEERSGIIVAS